MGKNKDFTQAAQVTKRAAETLEALTGPQQEPEQPKAEQPQTETTEKTVTFKIEPKKTERAELILPASLKAYFKELARLNNISFNALIVQFLQDFKERG